MTTNKKALADVSAPDQSQKPTETNSMNTVLPTTDHSKPRPLPESFEQSGFTLQQLKRQGRVALFERRIKTPGARPHYELVVIKVLKAGTIQGRKYPEREVYPKDEDWGTLGWTLVCFEDAQERFAYLVASSQKARIPHPLDPLYSTLALGGVKTADSPCDALVTKGVMR